MTFGVCRAASGFNPEKPMKSFLLLPVVFAGLTACAPKKEAQIETSPPVAEPAAPTTTATATVSPASPMMSLPQVTEAVQNLEYDRAVQGLAGLKAARAQMTDAQRLQYQQAVRDTTLALLQAQDKDPAAKAAYEKLSRVVTGR